MHKNIHTNRLIHETSPYLLQHAHNPVEWWPWCDDALQRARQDDKPILLSIGYSACHWCHVMAHESFEDASTAALMNRLFINIKVDREERPDLDKIYQTAHQLMNQRGGGWPLTMFLTPDTHTPIFAGTYFPLERRYGMPAFAEILQHVAGFYREHRNEADAQHQAFIAAFAQLEGNPQDANLISAAPLDRARHELEQHFDASHGGFGKAPKFPHPTNLERLLRHAVHMHTEGHDDKNAWSMLHRTLNAMAHGGVFDQLGGGFFRYSVDDEWMIPHFEKMLYDNGPLLNLYTEAYVASGDAVYERITHDIAGWVMRDMQSPEGGYYSALDADSEGEEGKYYVWTPQLVQSALTTDEFAVCAHVFGLDRTANFEGHWHLHVFADLQHTAHHVGQDVQTVAALLHTSREKLLQLRQQRTPPGRDEKILTAWNALMIKGMASAGRRLQRDEYIDSAQQAIDYIAQHLLHDGRLLAVYKDGQSKLMAYLDDYAFLIDALLESLQARWRDQDLQLAIQLSDALLLHFHDAQNGGFYFTAHDHETLLHRPKPVMDEAIPAGNAIAALSLQRLGFLLADNRYLAAAEHTLRFAWTALTHYAHAHAAMLHVLEEYLYPPQIIILRGETTAMQAWQNKIHRHYQPRHLSFAIPASARDLPEALRNKPADKQHVTAYICEGRQCLPPIYEQSAFIKYCQLPE